MGSLLCLVPGLLAHAKSSGMSSGFSSFLLAHSLAAIFSFSALPKPKQPGLSHFSWESPDSSWNSVSLVALRPRFSDGLKNRTHFVDLTVCSHGQYESSALCGLCILSRSRTCRNLTSFESNICPTSKCVHGGGGAVLKDQK